MKQYITQEQYDLLSADDQQRFVDWIHAKGDDHSSIPYRCSIGHLIWFLHDHEWHSLQFIKYGEVYHFGHPMPEEEQHKWHVSDGDYEYATVSYYATELIDALWDAVKAALSNKEQ